VDAASLQIRSDQPMIVLLQRQTLGRVIEQVDDFRSKPCLAEEPIKLRALEPVVSPEFIQERPIPRRA
jgi:hypothetical protein